MEALMCPNKSCNIYGLPNVGKKFCVSCCTELVALPKCGKCGKTVTPALNFCGECGRPTK